MPRMDRKDFFAHLRDMERERLIEEQEYKKSNRMPGMRVVLTAAGEARVAVGSGAAPTWAQGGDE